MSPVRGAGGGGKSGGGKSRAPVESPDSLRSRQSARIIDLISEGEIGGLVNGLQSVFLDDTPVQNADGTYNFSGVTLVTREGTQSQSYIPGFPFVESETQVSAEVLYDTPVTRSISNANANAARITVSVPRLTYQNSSNGDLSGTSVTLSIEINNAGGGFVPARIGMAQINLSRAEGFATSGVNSITAATLGVSWVGWVSGVKDMQSAGWRLEYRLQGASAWTVYATGTVAAAPQFATLIGEGGELYAGWIAPSGYFSRSIELPEGQYEFQVVQESGPGTMVLVLATGQVWSSVDVISGKTTSRYQRAYRIELPSPGPWDVRVRRLTPDSTQSNLQNAVWWDSVTEIIDARLRYPNCALAAVSVDAEQFSAIPTRGYEVYGLLVRVPSNYDPILRVYTGAWDGTFKVAWSNNPAWVFYDLVTSERYGLGRFVSEDQVDKWGLYAAAQYCDEMVPDGFGGEEPRFTCSLFLQTREEAFKVVNALASVFRAMVYWGGGVLVAVQDAPRDVAAIFSPANVSGGRFQYEGTSIRARHTVALVSWNDPDDRYRQKIEYVEDPDGIARYGVSQTEVLAVGCTSRGQAHRFGRWLLYTERMEPETVTFRAGLEGLNVSPGEIIQTSDPVRVGARLAGRLAEVGVSEVTLDADVALLSGHVYTLSVRLPDGAVESRQVSTAAGTTRVLAVSTPFSAAPVPWSMWALSSSSLALESWRVLQVDEVDDVSAEIVALTYRADKFDAVERDLVMDPLSTSLLSATPAPPTGLEVVQSLYLISAALVGARITVSWESSAPRFTFRWRRDGGNWTTVDGLTVPSYDIQPAEVGAYEFSVQSVSALGARSSPVSVSRDIAGLFEPPADLSSVSIQAAGGLAILTWALHASLDVRVGGRIRVRHSPDMATATWESSTSIGEAVAGNATVAVLPLKAGTYLLRAEDSSGVLSPTAVAVTTKQATALAWTSLGVVQEDDEFSGGHAGTMVAGLSLTLAGGGDFDDIAEFDAEPSVDYVGGVVTSGTYDFASGLDLGTVSHVRLSSRVVAQAVNLSDSFDTRLGDVDDWTDFDGTTGAPVDAWVEVRSTDDDPAGSPAWSAWQRLDAAEFEARAFDFRAQLKTDDSSYTIEVSELRVAADEIL